MFTTVIAIFINIIFLIGIGVFNYRETCRKARKLIELCDNE